MLHFLSRLMPRKEMPAPRPVAKGARRYIFNETFDRAALWDPQTIDDILADFPKGHIKEIDLFLILTECIANAVLHGQAQSLTFCARERGGVFLLSFRQTPVMLGRVAVILSLARSGQLESCTTRLPGGLGFPILLRLVHHITISHDYGTLRLWIHKRDPVAYN